MHDRSRHVACVGAGVIGRSWVVAFAAGGWPVRVYDPAISATGADDLLMRIRSALANAIADGVLTEPAEDILPRITISRTLDAAVSGATYIQESVPEIAAIKREVVTAVDAAADPEAVIVSSTSAIPGSVFLGDVPGRERCMVGHPINPPSVFALVELCPTPWTCPTAVSVAIDVLHSIGHRVIQLRREVPGFIVNRLQIALLSEALHLVGEGYCSPEDVDLAVQRTLGLRWALLGPFAAAHLNADAGIGEYLRKFGEPIRDLARHLKVDYSWDNQLIETLEEAMSSRIPVAEVPQWQAWRDRRLLALRQEVNQQLAAPPETTPAVGKSSPAAASPVRHRPV